LPKPRGDVEISSSFTWFLTEFTPSYSLTHNGDDAPQKPSRYLASQTPVPSINYVFIQPASHSIIHCSS